jgi:hypothetical protein
VSLSFVTALRGLGRRKQNWLGCWDA